MSSKRTTFNGHGEATVKPSSSQPSASTTQAGCAQSLDAYVAQDSVIKSDILWLLKVVKGHLSFRSCLDLGETFRSMFPDSQIAKKFALSKTKAAYSIVHGLAPFFKERLDDDIKKCPVYVACFDEALNKVAQRG